MPAGRPAFSLEPYKTVIWSWYIADNHSFQITRDLLHEHHPEIVNTTRPDYPSLRTLERTIQSWGSDFPKRNMPLNEVQKNQLMQRLWVLFYTYGLNNDEIMGFINKDNTAITKRT